METFHKFKDIAGFEKFLRSGKYPACHSSGCLDYVKIGGVVYTMHEFDEAGQTVEWANKKKNRIVSMDTENRYKNGYYDAKVIAYQAYSGLRDDIAYAQ